MVYCVAGGIALLVLEFSASPPSFLPGFILHRLRKLRQMLHFECHILTVATGRALCYLFFGSLLLADAGSALGTCVGGYLAFVGLAMLYVSRSAVAKLRALMPRAARPRCADAFARHDSDSDGKRRNRSSRALRGPRRRPHAARARVRALSLRCGRLGDDRARRVPPHVVHGPQLADEPPRALAFEGRATDPPESEAAARLTVTLFCFLKYTQVNETQPPEQQREADVSPSPRRAVELAACRRPLRSHGRSRSCVV